MKTEQLSEIKVCRNRDKKNTRKKHFSVTWDWMIFDKMTWTGRQCLESKRLRIQIGCDISENKSVQYIYLQEEKKMTVFTDTFLCRSNKDLRFGYQLDGDIHNQFELHIYTVGFNMTHKCDMCSYKREEYWSR